MFDRNKFRRTVKFFNKKNITIKRAASLQHIIGHNKLACNDIYQFIINPLFIAQLVDYKHLDYKKL